MGSTIGLGAHSRGVDGKCTRLNPSETKCGASAAWNLPFLVACLIAAIHASAAPVATNPAPARVATQYALISAHDYEFNDPTSWRLFGSNDRGHTWTQLDTRTNQNFTARCQRRVFAITNQTAFNTYRLQVDQSRFGSSGVHLAEFELIGPIVGVENEAELQANISSSREHPLMGPAANAFDHDPTTKWLDYGLGEPGGCWLQCEYTWHAELLVTNVSELRVLARRAATQNLLLDRAPEVVSNLSARVLKPARALSGYVLTSANDAPERDPRDWRLLGSNDGGKSWDTLDVRRNEVFATRFQKRTFIVTNQLAYAIYRLQIEAVASPGDATAVQLGEVEPLYRNKETPSRFSLVVSADSENPPMESADRAFDGDARTKWLAFSHPGSQASWIQWQLISKVDDLPVINLLRLNRLLAEPPATANTSSNLGGAAKPVRTLTGYALTSANDFPARDPRDWRLQGSRDDGRSWDNLDTRRNEFFTRRMQRRAFALPKPVSYPLYRLCIDCVAIPGTNAAAANSVQLAEIEPLYSSREAKVKLSVVVSAQGENGPRETAAMAFDGDPASKWLDLSNSDGNRASWIQWSYSAAETEPVIREDLVRALRSRSAQVMRVQFEGVLASVDPSSKRIGLLDESGFEVIELDAPLAGVAPGDRVRLSGRLRFERNQPKIADSRLISLGRLASGPDIKKEKPFPEHQDFFLGSVEGRVVSVSQDEFYVAAQVVPAKGSGPVQVNILNPKQSISDSLTNIIIHAQGVVEPVFDAQGQRVAGAVWVAGLSNLTIKASADVPRQPAAPPETPARVDEKNPLTQMHRIYDLARGQSTNGIPVKVRGVITYIDLGLSDFYLQSGPDSILVHDQMSAGLSPFLHQEGSYVELRAMAYAGSPPDIYPSGFVTVLGKGRMPQPLRHSWDYLMTGKDDGRWIEVDGVVAGVEEQRLVLTTRGGQFVAWVNELDKTLENRLLGSRVRIAGVCSPVLNQRDQRLGLRLLVPSGRNIQVVQAAPNNPFTLPSLAVSNVMRLDPEDAGQVAQLVKTTGVITHKGPQSFFLQDGSDGLRVVPRKDDGFGPGDHVEAVGLAEPDGLSPRLVQALVRKIGTAPLPQCMPIAFPGINTGSSDVNQDATRGQLDATLLGSSVRESFQVLELRSDKTEKVFHALLPITGGPMAALAPGSRLRLQGVYKSVTDTVPDFGQVVSSFEMYLNTPADITVLARPPWWSTRRTRWILAGVGGVLLVSLAWVGSLRRQVRQRTRELHEEIAERKRAEEAQLESQALYHSLVEHMPAGLYREDSEGRYVFANSWFCRLKGVSLEQILGKTPAELAHATGALPNGSAENLREHELIMQTGQLIEREEDLLDAEGQMRCLHIVKSPVITPGGWVIGSQGMLFDITGRKQAEARLGEAHRDLLQASRLAGMAEVATSVLHNVGNVLNSVNISSTVIGKKLKQSRVANLGKLAVLLEEQAGDLPGYFATHPKAKELPRYLSALAVHLASEQEQLLQEVASLTRNIDHIKEIVAMQQNYARVSGVLEWLPVPDLVEDALRLNAGAMQRHNVHVIRDYAEMPAVMADKHKILQILVNLIRNAKYALDEAAPHEKRLILQTRTNNGNVQISVIDNGIGIPPENLTRIFGHGFTTRKNGHGFGLHSGALAAREMGGSLTVHSDGPCQGAVFTLEFPCQPNAAENGADSESSSDLAGLAAH